MISAGNEYVLRKVNDLKDLGRTYFTLQGESRKGGRGELAMGRIHPKPNQLQ